MPEFTESQIKTWLKKSIEHHCSVFQVIVNEGHTDPEWCTRAWNQYKNWVVSL